MDTCNWEFKLKDGYYDPKLTLPTDKQYKIGKYGLMHLAYLKKHKRGTYSDLLSTCKLNGYLHTIDLQAKSMLNSMVKQAAKQQGISEQLKADNSLLWAQKMNDIQHSAEEVICCDLLYV